MFFFSPPFWLFFSIFYSRTLFQDHSLILSLPLSLTHSLSISFSPSLSLSLTLSLSLSLSPFLLFSFLFFALISFCSTYALYSLSISFFPCYTTLFRSLANFHGFFSIFLSFFLSFFLVLSVSYFSSHSFFITSCHLRSPFCLVASFTFTSRLAIVLDMWITLKYKCQHQYISIYYDRNATPKKYILC